MSQPGKVLVMGDDTRSFLATVRSLGRKGIEVHAAPFNLRTPALASKYIRQVHRLPYYLDGGAQWLAALRTLMQAEQFDLIVACEERSLLPLYQHQHELPGTCALALPGEAALTAFFDKLNTRQLATQLGVPIAKGRPMQADDSADTLLAELTLPIVAKQRQSYTWPDLYVRSSVKIIPNRSELESWLRNNYGGFEAIFFEEMFAGQGLGVSVLCRQGVVLQAFEHHRAHELSGSSYYRQSAAIDAGRLAAVTAMVQAVGYTGLAMFEFKRNEHTGEWILLEVNARPWGSMPLPVAAGVDFPYLLYQMLVKEDLPPRRTYPLGVYARNLIPDLWQLRIQLQALSPNRGQQLGHFARWIVEFGRVLIGREHQDSLVLDDLRPGVVEIKQFVAEHWGLRFTQGRTHRSAAAPSLAHRVTAAQAQGQPAHLVFVCQGNICRSPYAESKARQLFAGQSAPPHFSSAGMLPRNRRPSPAVAITAAAQQGVDLGPHQSQHAHESLLTAATAIVIFDHINLHSVLNRYPDMHDKIYLLGEFLPDRKNGDIMDPDGHDLALFLTIYRDIDTAIHHLFDLLPGHLSG